MRGLLVALAVTTLPLMGTPGPVFALTGPGAPDGAARSDTPGVRDAHDTGRVVGLVRDGRDGRGIGGVSIHLEGPEERTAVTDSEGVFRFELLPPGTYAIRARHLAYEALEVEVEVVGDDRTTRVEIQLLAEAIALEPVVVEVEGRRPTFGPLAEVYDRVERQRLLGLGTILTRDDIENRVVGRVSDLLRGMAGVRLAPGPDGNTVHMRRAASFRGCPVQIYVDGMKVGTGSPDLYVLPMEVEIIEVYRGAAQVPPEYSGSDAQCGVVAVWTRRGA